VSVKGGYPGRTDLQLRFRVRGKDLNPQALTLATGIEPARQFRIGEARGAYARTVAGWDWESDPWTDANTTALFDLALLILGPHEAAFARCTEEGATTIRLTVVGSVYGEVIATPEEADKRGFAPDRPGMFEPFFAADRVAIWMGPEIMGFLSRIRATFDTHIDADLYPRPS
jgi:hypothetical protein